MFLDKFVTQYDDSISGELNIDPLGLLVIWSVYGKAIFKNRVNSISNDVRNYTINLFHHCVVRDLIHDEDIQLSKALSQPYPDKNALAFKQACLLHLENIFVFSILKHSGEIGVDTSGVLGISKAGNLWNASEKNPDLTFTHLVKGQILVRQLTLGTSGRYKTPMMEMGFFDKSNNYKLPESAPTWDRSNQFIGNNKQLSELRAAIFPYMKSLFLLDEKQPCLSFSEIPASLKGQYAQAFKSSPHVGGYVNKFLLDLSGLNQGTAGALYRTLAEAQTNGGYKDAETVLAQTKEHLVDKNEIEQIDHIQQIEPFLAELDLLFTLILSEKSHDHKDIEAKWKNLKRDETLLPNMAADIAANTRLISMLGVTGEKRLKLILDLQYKTRLTEQIEHLLSYHNFIMQTRGQQSWLRLDKKKTIHVQVKQRKVPDYDERPTGSWFNRYYIPQFANLVNGFQGIEP